MAEKYEYSMIVTTGQLNPGAADATAEELSQSVAPQLGSLVQKVGKNLANFPGNAPANKQGGWEIVSHDITRIDRHLLTTFLIRRPLAT